MLRGCGLGLLQVSDLAVITHVDREAFAAERLNLTVYGFGKTFTHLPEPLLKESSVNARLRVAVWLHARSGHIAVGHKPPSV